MGGYKRGLRVIMKTLFKAFCFSFLVSNLQAGENNLSANLNSVDYFPTQVGNKWVYFYFDAVPFFFPDTVEILGTGTIDDTLYYVSSAQNESNILFPKYARKDSAGNAYARFYGNDQLLYKIDASTGEQWQVTLNPPQTSGSEIMYTITLTGRDAVVETYSGVFQNCLEFELRTGSITEASYYVWLAPRVGIVRIDGWGIAGFYSLKRANIDGSPVSSHVFQVFAVTPIPEERDVNDSTVITFAFASISKSMIGDSNLAVVSRREGLTTGALSYDSDARTYVFVPDHLLPAADTITVTLSAGITDSYGDSLDGNSDWKYEGVPADNYHWRFFTRKVDAVEDGRHGVIGYHLNQSFPNPFNPTATIRYRVPERAFVDLSLYDVLGRKVKTLVRGIISPGVHEIKLEGGDLASGIYFYVLSAAHRILSGKALLIK